jgi:hypothetical protein
MADDVEHSTFYISEGGETMRYYLEGLGRYPYIVLRAADHEKVELVVVKKEPGGSETPIEIAPIPDEMATFVVAARALAPDSSLTRLLVDEVGQRFRDFDRAIEEQQIDLILARIKMGD